MITGTTDRFGRLVKLLKELFQLDKPDLDFGFYRIMHAKAAEVTRFLEVDLLPQVKDAFQQYRSADRTTLKHQLAEAQRDARGLGVDPDTAPRVQELREAIDAGTDVDALEADVYDHLYRFFRRYYSEGDFISQRVYKDGVYAIPYQGEEVKLHWANADQYYIKTTEYLKDYSFRLRPDAESDPMRVHFRLADAAEGEHGNIKAQDEKARRFVLSAEDFAREEEGPDGVPELVIRFEYRAAKLGDWPKHERKGKKRPPRQKDLNEAATAALLDANDLSSARWTKELAATHVRADGTQAGYSRLRSHLDRYTARNTYDYFIHKNLGGFLRRELDFYVKNEVMHLDDIEHESAPRVEEWLSKIRVIRAIAHKIIDFLAQLEGFQKRLWLKKKFVVETSYCVALGSIPEAFHGEIAANRAQHDEWVDLHGIDGFGGDLASPAYSNPLTAAFLRAHPTLMVDTKHFDADFTGRLLEVLGTAAGLDDLTDGVLFHSENFQALRLMERRYRGRVDCVYIDPPYNTGNDGFAYKDNLQHSSWAVMVHQSSCLARGLASPRAAFFASIDEVEQPLLRQLLDGIWGGENHVADLIWAAGRKNDSKLVSISHEYILVYARARAFLRNNKVEWRQRKKGLEDIYKRYRILSRKHATADHLALTAALKKWFRELPDGHPAKAHKHYSHVDRRGIYFPADIAWPGRGGPRYDVIHPVTGQACAVPRAGWRFTEETMQQWLSEDRIHFGTDETSVPKRKSYLQDHERQVPYSVFYQDGRAATVRLRHVLGNEDFGYPKDENVIGDCVSMVSDGGLTLDYFAGSGTTGHAAINLRRMFGGGGG